MSNSQHECFLQYRLLQIYFSVLLIHFSRFLSSSLIKYEMKKFVTCEQAVEKKRGGKRGGGWL